MISRVTEALGKVKGSMGCPSAMHCLVLSVTIFAIWESALCLFISIYFDRR